MNLRATCVTISAILIGLLPYSQSQTASQDAPIRHNHTCNFEVLSDCGWIIGTIDSEQGELGIARANDPPLLGPVIDTNPGNGLGHYFYFSSQTLSMPERILRFPSHSLVCGLSFSYYVIGPLDLGIIRQNLAFQSIFMTQSLDNSTNSSMWTREELSFNTSKEFDGGLYFEVSPFDLGEAIIEPSGIKLFLGVDDILLTFCLPCDYDQLESPGGLMLEGPTEIKVQLRFTTQIFLNGTSPVCPNEGLLYNIDSVDPSQVASIFSLNPSTGTLTITASGPGLAPNGVDSGSIEISVYLPGSNYTHTSPPHKQSLFITFQQAPTITHTAPPTLPVQIDLPFTYDFFSSSDLGLTLNYGKITTNPSELLSNISLTTRDGHNEAVISGIISLNRILPIILEQTIVPNISVPIVDSIGGIVIATTQLIIQQAPPIFNQSHYEFNILEESGTGEIFGPIPILDPNGDMVLTPVITNLAFEVIPTVSPSTIFTNFELLSLLRLNYEQIPRYDFTLVAYDSVNSSLSSQASVRVNVLPKNEFTPVFVQPSLHVEISDVSPMGCFVEEFDATDNDDGVDGEITYSITGGNDDGFFDITGMGFGEVKVRRSPILPHTYVLTITARDGGNPPLSSTATLTVLVTTSSMVDCTQPAYGPPTIAIASPINVVELTVNSELSLECDYTGNPTVRGYKWSLSNISLLTEDSSDHYVVTERPSVLTVHNLTADDAGVYRCNVTNQCGSDYLSYYVEIIDYPNPPLSPRVLAGPDTDSLTIAWDPPSSDTIRPNVAVIRPLVGYEVWVRASGTEDYQTVATVDPTVREVNVTGLHPGTLYWLVVASTNMAGSSPSDSIKVTTISSLPKLSFLRATEQINDSILIEWELEYNGGFPIVSFELQVILQTARAKRDTPTNPDLIYHTDVDNGHLVTRSVENGRSYVVMAIVYNTIGSSDEFAYVYVGHKDILTCEFEEADSSGCPWQLGMGVITNAESAAPSLPNEDSTGNSLGHYIAAESQQELVIMSYNKAWYVCGYSFYYQLRGEGSMLILRTTSGDVIWSTAAVTMSWLRVSTAGDQFITSGQDQGLEFVLRGTNAAAGIDDVKLNFCLPCDFALLEDTNGVQLSYPNFTKLYLRTEQTLSLSAALQGCTSAAVSFTTSRVVPSELESSFSLSVDTPRSVVISVNPIPSDRVLPHTAGFLEVIVSVVHSDYRPDSTIIEKTALVEFILLQSSENCSLAENCGFESGESGCGLWELGSGVQLLTGSESPVKDLNVNTGTFLYGDYSVTTVPSSTVTTTSIADTYCAISFSYSTPPSLELVISVGGLGEVWSSLLLTRNSGSSWLTELVPIDLEAVSLLADRELSFLARQVEGNGGAGLDTTLPAYAALDNITLHPCIDCNTPECSFSSCIPGHYFSLVRESCITCPQGYFCPDWRGLPIPCPPGTYSEEMNAASQSVCKLCPDNTYSLMFGSVSCQTCPAGFSCLNVSHFPVSEGSSQCSTDTPAITSELTAVSMLTVIVGVSAGGVALLLCLLLSCVVACWCYRNKKGKSEKKSARERRLLSAHDDGMSIGSAGSLGRNSVTTMSTFDGRGRRWKRGKDTSTLMSYLTDDEADNPINFSKETSWADTEELTKPGGSGGGQETVVFKNGRYEEGTELQLVDIGDHRNQRSKENNGIAHF